MKLEDFWSLSSGLKGVRWKTKRSGDWRGGYLRVRLRKGYGLRKRQDHGNGAFGGGELKELRDWRVLDGLSTPCNVKVAKAYEKSCIRFYCCCNK